MYVTVFFALEGNGEIYYSEGGYDYYIEKRKQRLNEEDQSKPKQGKEEVRVKPKQNKLSFKDARELEMIEGKIIEAEAEVEKIERIFTSPDFYAKYADKTNELNRQLEDAKEKVKLLYTKWEELEKLKQELI